MQLPYSPLIHAVLTSINDDSQFIQLAGQLSDIDDYVEELTKKELTLPITRLHKLMNENEVCYQMSVKLRIRKPSCLLLLNRVFPPFKNNME